MASLTNPGDEARRLATLRRYEILDTPPDDALDAIARLAAKLCATPTALITLVDERRQWSKSVVGEAAKELAIDLSFCVHAMHPPATLIVPDATCDERFASNPIVTCDGGLRFYAGAPLISPEGDALGTLSVIDRVPRTLSDEQESDLRVLADSVMAHLNLRKQRLETARAESALLEMLAEYRRSEQEIRGSEQRYRMLFTQNPTPMWVFDLATLRFLAVNKAAVERYGYTEAEFLAMRLPDIREAAEVPVLERAISRIGSGATQATSTRHRLKSGELIDVEVAGDAITFDGRPARLVLVHDVTAQVAAERLRRESEERYWIAVKGSSAGLWDWNVRTGHAFLSARYQELVGYADGELKQSVDTFHDLLHPDDRARSLAAVDAHFGPDRTPFDIDYRLRTKNGEYRWFNARGQALWDDEGVAYRMAGSISDITERRLAEEQIAEQAALLNEAQDAVMLTDLAHRVLFWNRGAERLYGWSAAEAQRQTVHEMHAFDRVAHDAALSAMLAAGRWEGTLQHRTRDGRVLTVESRWALTHDRLGQPRSILVFNTDVTERKRNEAAQLRRQRMESIGTLAGGIAHDLNNLLSPMMMSVELLRQAATDEASLDLLQSVQSSAARGAALVQQVLSFARGVEGQRVPVSPALLVREVQHIIRDSFPKSIRVRATHDEDTWSVAGDPTQLHQVLLNLCVNARDAMPDGGELAIGVENVEVDATFAALHSDAKPGDYVVIRVSDNGTGIAPDVRERIFEPFFSTKEVGKGTGLGLSTTLAIVRSHDGFMTMYSEPGVGTTFRVFVPASRTESAPAIAPHSPVMERGAGELILVVDDEEAIRRVAQRTLERFGYRVLTAAHGLEALELYVEHGHEIAVVFTDMAMPEMDGPELITELRELNPSVRIVGASGLSSADGIGRTLNEPLVHFVSKPYTADAMLQAMRDVLHG